MFAPSPSELAKDATKEQTEVEQLGTITLEELNKYHCDNEERRLLSLFGIIFDVTSSEKGYGKNGACKLIFLHEWGTIFFFLLVLKRISHDMGHPPNSWTNFM